ncbi:hypothetical protein BAUR9175_02946 [Brevibacterium aurantiacum]|uniref:Uncharacterized protein n=1 Tax=Brevibacterium aurantiacum TaxID=273384 RepID=A0A2H1JZC5_BREAU|nr:hypothetical protein BAUR9175_02946 [Brevibacterium aurantiacum]
MSESHSVDATRGADNPGNAQSPGSKVKQPIGLFTLSAGQ